jgi:hypothetical protein
MMNISLGTNLTSSGFVMGLVMGIVGIAWTIILGGFLLQRPESKMPPRVLEIYPKRYSKSDRRTDESKTRQRG